MPPKSPSPAESADRATSPAASGGIGRRLARTGVIVLVNLAMLAVGLLLLDVAATKFGLLTLRAWQTGIPEVGFATPLTVIHDDDAGTDVMNVAILGDSHHQYTEDNGATHQSRVLHELLRDAGMPNRVITLGTPRYAPIQEMVAYERLIEPHYDVDAVVFLIYAGNDFAELLRNDDRPRLERASDGQPFIRPPHWLLQRTPDSESTNWPRDSRLLYLANAATPDNLVLKVIAADRALELFHPTPGQRIEYLRNLKRFKDNRIGYSGAIPSQFLHQYYLYARYPDIFRREVHWRLVYFFREFHRRHPALPAYAFFLPSAPAIGAMTDRNSAILQEVLQRSGLGPLDFPRLEHELFVLLQGALAESGAPFRLVDLSPALREANRADGTQTFYDEPTIHIDTQARRVVAEQIAHALTASGRPHAVAATEIAHTAAPAR